MTWAGLDLSDVMQMDFTPSEFDGFVLKPGDVLLAEASGSPGEVGKPAIWNGEIDGCCFQNTLIRVRTRGPLPSFLRYRFLYDAMAGHFAAASKGVGIHHLGAQRLAAHEILVPSAEVQARVVAEVEKQFTRLDAGVAALERIRVKLRRYRTAVVGAACTAPVGDRWRTVKLGDVAESLDHRRVPINKTERAKRVGQMPYYGANGRVGWIDEYLFDEPLVLVVEDETFTGRTKPFSYRIEGKSWVNNHAHVLRARPGVDTAYLNCALSYYPFTPLTTGTTGRRKLTQKALLNAPLAVPPLEEQLRVVRDVDAQLSVADALERAVDLNLQRASALRVAVLRSAFEGRLVAPEPARAPAA